MKVKEGTYLEREGTNVAGDPSPIKYTFFLPLCFKSSPLLAHLYILFVNPKLITLNRLCCSLDCKSRVDLLNVVSNCFCFRFNCLIKISFFRFVH